MKYVYATLTVLFVTVVLCTLGCDQEMNMLKPGVDDVFGLPTPPDTGEVRPPDCDIQHPLQHCLDPDLCPNPEVKRSIYCD